MIQPPAFPGNSLPGDNNSPWRSSSPDFPCPVCGDTRGQCLISRTGKRCCCVNAHTQFGDQKYSANAGGRYTEYPALCTNEFAGAVEPTVKLFAETFFNRSDKIPYITPWKQQPGVLTGAQLENLLRSHLAGWPTRYFTTYGGLSRPRWDLLRIGTYFLDEQGSTRVGCIDLDGGKDHAFALADASAAALAVYLRCWQLGIPCYLEMSKGGAGWHLWFFLTESLPAKLVRALLFALIPAEIRLADGSFALPDKGRGIEVFPKSTSGLGGMVYVPEFSQDKGGRSAFFQPVGEEGGLAPFVPTSFEKATPADVANALAALGVKADTTPAPRPKVGEPAAETTGGASAATDKPGATTNQDPRWAEWEREAIAKLDLGDIFDLTGRKQGEGWLECRDLITSASGDQNPSAGVSDGTGPVPRGIFRSFVGQGWSCNVFTYLMKAGWAKDLGEANRIIAKLSGVPLPEKTAAQRRAAREQDRQRRKEARQAERDRERGEAFLERQEQRRATGRGSPVRLQQRPPTLREKSENCPTKKAGTYEKLATGEDYVLCYGCGRRDCIGCGPLLQRMELHDLFWAIDSEPPNAVYWEVITRDGPERKNFLARHNRRAAKMMVNPYARRGDIAVTERDGSVWWYTYTPIPDRDGKRYTRDDVKLRVVEVLKRSNGRGERKTVAKVAGAWRQEPKPVEYRRICGAPADPVRLAQLLGQSGVAFVVTLCLYNLLSSKTRLDYASPEEKKRVRGMLGTPARRSGHKRADRHTPNAFTTPFDAMLCEERNRPPPRAG
jgi:hypothetical protein